MHVVIAKVDEVLFEGQAQSMTVPGAEGQMTLLDKHEPLISTLKAGTIVVRVRDGAQPQEFVVDGGVIEVRADGATVIL